MKKLIEQRGQKKAYIKENSVDKCFYVDITIESDVSEYGDVLHSNKVFKSASSALKFINRELV